MFSTNTIFISGPRLVVYGADKQDKYVINIKQILWLILAIELRQQISKKVWWSGEFFLFVLRFWTRGSDVAWTHQVSDPTTTTSQDWRLGDHDASRGEARCYLFRRWWMQGTDRESARSCRDSFALGMHSHPRFPNTFIYTNELLAGTLCQPWHRPAQGSSSVWPPWNRENAMCTHRSQSDGCNFHPCHRFRAHANICWWRRSHGSRAVWNGKKQVGVYYLLRRSWRYWWGSFRWWCWCSHVFSTSTAFVLGPQLLISKPSPIFLSHTTHTILHSQNWYGLGDVIISVGMTPNSSQTGRQLCIKIVHMLLPLH